MFTHVNVYAVVDDALSSDFPLGDSLEAFVRREDAERFIEEVRGDEPELATYLQGRGARTGGRRLELATWRRPSTSTAFPVGLSPISPTGGGSACLA